MNRRVRLGILLALAGIALIVVGFIVLTNFINNTLRPVGAAPTPVAPVVQKVVITTHDIPIGTVLKAGDVQTADVPIELAPRNTLAEPEAVVGKMTTTNLASGELLMSHRLADPTNVNHDLAFTMDESLVLMAWQPGDLMSSLNIIQRGDVIDILASIEEEIPATQFGYTQYDESGQPLMITKMFTFDAFQKAGVTAVVVDIINQGEQQQAAAPITAAVAGQPAATPVPTAQPNPKDVNTRAYLLALKPQDALVLKHLQDSAATFDIVLRNPTSTLEYSVTPVISEYLVDRYQLQLVPIGPTP